MYKGIGSSGAIAYGMLFGSIMIALFGGEYQWTLITSGLFAIVAEIYDYRRFGK